MQKNLASVSRSKKIKNKNGSDGMEGIKNGRLLTSHRYNRLPLLSSDPGGVQQELAVEDLPVQI